MFSDLDRQQLVIPFTAFAGHLSAAGSETTKDEIAIFRLPTNGVITGMSACYTDEAGTGPALDLTLERGTTVLITLAQMTTNETFSEVLDQEIKVAKGETLNIKGDAANTDNTFDGLVILIYWRPFQS